MSEVQKEADGVDAAEAAAAPTDERERDWFLQMLVSFANDSDVGFGVTLFVKGAVVSGTLISMKTYFKELGEAVSGALKHEPLAQIFADIPKNSLPTPRPRFVHLRDARVFHPGTMPMPQEGTLWRGRLAEVDGFTVGVMSASATR